MVKLGVALRTCGSRVCALIYTQATSERSSPDSEYLTWKRPVRTHKLLFTFFLFLRIGKSNDEMQ